MPGEVQKRLQGIWARLQCPDAQQMDMAIKYSSHLSSIQIDQVGTPHALLYHHPRLTCNIQKPRKGPGKGGRAPCHTPTPDKLFKRPHLTNKIKFVQIARNFFWLQCVV